MPHRKVHIRPRGDENNDDKLLVLNVAVLATDETEAHEEAEEIAQKHMASDAFKELWKHGPARVTWSGVRVSDNLVDDLLTEFSDRTGWNDRSKVLQLTRFIDKMRLLHEFESFLEGVELEEENMRREAQAKDIEADLARLDADTDGDPLGD